MANWLLTLGTGLLVISLILFALLYFITKRLCGGDYCLGALLPYFLIFWAIRVSLILIVVGLILKIVKIVKKWKNKLK